DPSKAVSADNVEQPAGAEPFDSGNIDRRRTWSHTFTVPGTYRYVCVPHELAGMVGVVVVEGGSWSDVVSGACCFPCPLLPDVSAAIRRAAMVEMPTSSST